MGSKAFLKTNYAVEAKYDAYFTGQQVQVTSDSGWVLCECGDGVGVVSLTTGKVTGRITCEEDQVTSIALAPDDSSLVVALKSTSLQQYNWPGLELMRSFRSYHKGPITTMTWDSTSTLLVTGAADSSARVWDLRQKYCTHSLKGATGVFSVVLFHPDLSERARVYGAAGTTIYIWRLEAGSSELECSLDAHHSTVTAMQLTQDCKHLVSCGLDRVMVLWDLESLSSKKVVVVLESLSGLSLQPPGTLLPGVTKEHDQNIIATVVGDKGVPSVWAVDIGRELWRAPEPLVTPPDQEGVTLINQLAHCPSLNSFVMTTYDHSILMVHTSSMEVWKQLAGYNEQILDAVFVGEGETHLVVATNSIQLQVYDCSTFNCRLLFGHTALVLSLTTHPTLPQVFASSSHDNTALVWRLRSDGLADCIASAVGHTLSVGTIVLAQGFMITGGRDMCIKKWKTDKELNKDHNREVKMTSLTSTHTEKAHEKDINSMCVSVNGKLLASGSQDKTAKVWRSDNLSLVGTMQGHKRGVWHVQFSPVDEVLATASADATIRIWTLADCATVATLEGHDMGVLRVHWLSQGQQLLSTSSDGLLKLWNVRTRQCCQTYDEHEDKAWALAVSRDEARVVTGGEDSKLVLWNDVTQLDQQKAQVEADRLAAEEQTLANLLKDKKWTKALRIAIGLSQPFRALRVVRELLDETPDQLPRVVAKLNQDHLATLLGFISQWNTKTKNSREAQSIVNVMLKSRLPEDLESLVGWRTTLEALLPYTERHYHRTSALHQSSAIITYMASALSLSQQSQGTLTPYDMNELDLLRTIPSVSIKKEEEDDSDLRAAIEDSVMEVDTDVEMKNEEESDDDTSVTYQTITRHI
ncbi:hypothetical protein Pmani_009946 [Petrolisthes manimaculis]|uniref:U3 small nucleolar RNA-associated protein 13 C-terminal domain-containing protein n=1 Tax=Petrolisthes manimaculis TaxID=1843537 RepID=A0AAE1UCF4_9EUCA|nr:hypothetical protein Pmani_009946 [Petrolisthes manimaculis]